MPVSPIRVGLVGLGNISSIHAEAVKNSRYGTLSAAASSRKEKREAFANKWSVRGFETFEAMLESSDVDLVSICTPSGTHLDYGEKAAKAGKHVVIEKPIEITLKRAARLLNVCSENDVQLAVIYQSRFMKPVRQMKEAIDSGRIGRPFMATASVKWYRTDEYYREAPWRGTLELDGGGAVINQSIHTIDLLQWMMGEVATIQAKTGTFTHEGIEGEDNAVAALEFASGAIGTFVASTSVRPAQPRKIEIHGTAGTARLVDNEFRLIRPGDDESSGGEGKATGGEDPLANFAYEPHRDQFDEIFEAIRKGERPPVSGPESLNSLSFVEAIYRSSAEKRAISPADLIP
ncbi:MAG: Gfo/Idh/MocA family oxidoreductase [Balneolaceae bacterium]